MAISVELSIWAGAVSGSDAQSQARDELSKAEYHRDDPNAIEQLQDWIIAKLERGIGHASWDNGDTLVLLFLGALLGLAVYLTLRAGRMKRTERAANPDWLAPQVDIDHRQAAMAHTANGAYDLALREWLREIVRTLEQRGIVEPTPGRTGSELAHLAAPRIPGAAPALYAAVEAFNEVWFAERRATLDDAQAGEAAADAIRRARLAEPELHGVVSGYSVPS